MSQLQDTCGCPSSSSSVANPSTGVGRDRAVTGPVPDPSPAPTLTHCITALEKPSVTVKPARYCVQKAPLSRSDVQLNLNSSLCTSAKQKCLCSHSSPGSCASSTCTHLLFSFFSSSPSLTAFKGKRWQQDNCWEFLLLYRHKPPL